MRATSARLRSYRLLRLIVASVDTARRIGINWWETDPWLAGREAEDDRRGLRERVGRLERQLESSFAGSGPGRPITSPGFRSRPVVFSSP